MRVTTEALIRTKFIALKGSMDARMTRLGVGYSGNGGAIILSAG